MTNDEHLARAFNAISHPRRAAIFRFITDNKEHAASYQELQSLTGLADGSLIHHLRCMEHCGLLRRVRKGQIMVYRLTPGDFLRISRLAQFMVTSPALSDAA